MSQGVSRDLGKAIRIQTISLNKNSKTVLAKVSQNSFRINCCFERGLKLVAILLSKLTCVARLSVKTFIYCKIPCFPLHQQVYLS